jgi:hypothetical protein
MKTLTLLDSNKYELVSSLSSMLLMEERAGERRF